MEQPAKNKNINAVAIGFFLILLVSVGTYLRSASFNKTNQKNNFPTTPITQEKIEAKLISDTDLLKKITIKNNLLIVDIRQAADFSQEHIVDSRNLPFDSLESSLASLDKKQEIVIVDNTNTPESLKFLDNLFKTHSFNNVSVLDGGFSAWKTNGNPTIAPGNLDSFTDRSKVNFIDTDALKKQMATENNLLIIDVRKSNQYAEGHLKGAINIFLDDLEKKRAEITIGKKIIVYDNDGMWAFQAATRLFDLGFFNALALSDGLDTWKQKKYEIVK